MGGGHRGAGGCGLAFGVGGIHRIHANWLNLPHGEVPLQQNAAPVVASPAPWRLGLLGSLGGTSAFFAASGPPQRVRCRRSGAAGRVQTPAGAGAAACAGAGPWVGGQPNRAMARGPDWIKCEKGRKTQFQIQYPAKTGVATGFY